MGGGQSFAVNYAEIESVGVRDVTRNVISWTATDTSYDREKTSNFCAKRQS